MFLIIIVILILAEALALVWLLNSVGRFGSFWDKKATESGELTYLALGDSAAQGIGASSPMRGYVGLVAKKIEAKTGKSVKIINLSKTGATMQDHLNDQAPQIKDIKADFVTIEIGANDVAEFDAANFRMQFKEVLKTLPSETYVANMPLFNSRPKSTKPAKEASVIIGEEIANFDKLTLVDLQTETSENQSIFGFAPDLFHPNNLSYKNWAHAFWDKIEPNIK